MTVEKDKKRSYAPARVCGLTHRNVFDKNPLNFTFFAVGDLVCKKPHTFRQVCVESKKYMGITAYKNRLQNASGFM